MRNLYALLVGINDYQAPISKLRGCIKDLDQINTLLDKYYTGHFDVHLKRLEDRDATYRNIIDSFRAHLGPAGPSDVAWFHFSGHGSEEYTANEMWVVEPNGKDQTLVCYDSREEGAEHLADKELAVLLHEIATQFPDGRQKDSPPHIVVSLDCCHSGSGTRTAGEGDEVMTRNTTSSGRKRLISTYIDGYYERQGKRIQVPAARHVVLSACESVQRAGDLTEGGAFTTGLMRALDSAEGNISYADLYLQARSSVHKIRDSQTPQFETIENFDPYTRFLDGSTLGSPERFPVVRDGDDWYVKCGAIHGLPTDPDTHIELEIQSPAPEFKPVGDAHILSVGAQRSKIDLSVNRSLGKLLGSVFTKDDEEYRAVLKYLPAPPEYVYLGAGTDVLKSKWDTSKNICWTDGQDDHTLSVEAVSGRFMITDLERGDRVFSTAGTTEGDADIILDALGKIVKWRRFVRLQNKSPQSRLGDIAQFAVKVLDKQNHERVFDAPEIKLYATPEKAVGGKFGFNPVVRLNDFKQRLYFYLFYLSADYAIECTDGEIIYRPEEHWDTSHIELPLWKTIRGFGPGPDERETTSYFKLLITSEQLDHQQFQQSSLGKHRSALEAWDSGKIPDDWTAITMAVTIIKEEVSLKPGVEASLAGGTLTVLPTSRITGSASLSMANSRRISADPVHQFPRLSRDGLELLDLQDIRGGSSFQVLEITFLSRDVENRTLDIVLRQPLDKEVLPIAFDGQHFRVVGDSERNDGDTTVRIQDLPQTGIDKNPVQSPFTTEEQDSTLFATTKIGFFTAADPAKAKHLHQASCLCCP